MGKAGYILKHLEALMSCLACGASDPCQQYAMELFIPIATKKKGTRTITILNSDRD